MMHGPSGLPYSSSESKDGTGAADHDQPYTFDRQNPHVDTPWPFNQRQFCRLLILRGLLHSNGNDPRHRTGRASATTTPEGDS